MGLLVLCCVCMGRAKFGSQENDKSSQLEDFNALESRTQAEGLVNLKIEVV